jgi:hypothetical protein
MVLQLDGRDTNQDDLMKFNNIIPPQYNTDVEKLIHKLEFRNIITRTKRNQLQCIMGLKIRLKPDGSVRIVVNGSKLSEYLVRYNCKMPNKKMIFDAVQNSNYACVIDIEDMFYNIPVAEESKKYLGICFQGKYYKFNYAPMGISTSCEACAHITNSIAEQVHKTTIVQLDDFLVVGKTKDQVKARRDRLLERLKKAPLPVNLKKSKLKPVQELDYLSYHLNFKNHTVTTKETNLTKAKQVIDNVTAGTIKNRELQSIVGVVTANAPHQEVIDQLAPVRQGIIYGKNQGDKITEITPHGLQVLKQVHERCKEDHVIKPINKRRAL